ncbi:MAG: isoprenylcysteine carboxylmethyltransferase family protein [Alphaproteobacteria bacterium]
MTGDDKDLAGVIAPPPLIYLAFLLLGVGLDYVWPVAVIPEGVQYPAGFLLIALGLALFGAAVRRFGKAETSVQTRKPTTAIITDGPFRFSRNPIYLAMSLSYAGIAIAADNLWILGLLVPALAVIRCGVISREERYLERKFAEEYLRYKASVRRWL